MRMWRRDPLAPFHRAEVVTMFNVPVGEIEELHAKGGNDAVLEYLEAAIGIAERRTREYVTIETLLYFRELLNAKERPSPEEASTA